MVIFVPAFLSYSHSIKMVKILAMLDTCLFCSMQPPPLNCPTTLSRYIQGQSDQIFWPLLASTCRVQEALPLLQLLQHGSQAIGQRRVDRNGLFVVLPALLDFPQVAQELSRLQPRRGVARDDFGGPQGVLRGLQQRNLVQPVPVLDPAQLRPADGPVPLEPVQDGQAHGSGGGGGGRRPAFGLRLRIAAPAAATAAAATTAAVTGGDSQQNGLYIVRRG